jgi:hypothetical protein
MTVLQRLTDLMLFAGCVLATLSVGAAFVRRWAPFGIGRLEAVTLSLSLGLVILANSIFVIGLLGWLHRAVLIGLLAACYAAGLRDALGELWRRRFPYPFAERLAELSGIEKAWLVLLLLLDGLALILCFVPPWLGEWDSLSYHLAVPKLYWQDGRIHYLPFTHHAQFPMTPQMLYLLGLGLTNLRSAAVAKAFHWLFFVVCQLVLVSWGICLPQRSLRAGVLAAVAFGTMPLAFSEASTAYVDVALTAFVSLSLWALVRFAQQPDGRWLLWAGIFAGAAAGTKYTGLLCVALLIPLAFWAARRQGVKAWGAIALSAVLASLIAAPWYVKNWLWTGNPVFPFAYGIFGGRQWSAAMAQAYTLSNREFGGGRDVLTLFALPFNLTLNEIRFGHCAGQWLGTCPSSGCTKRWKCGKFDNVDSPNLSIGILPLSLLPTGLLLFRAGEPLVGVGSLFIALVSGFWLAWWFWEAQYLRYLLPTFALWSVWMGAVGAAWQRVSKGMALTVRVVITVGLAYNTLIALWLSRPLLPVALGWMSDAEFLRETTPAYRVAEFVNGALPRDAVIATYGMPLGYYLERRYFWADSGHNRLIPYERLKGLNDLMAAWQKLGVTHLIIDWRYVPSDSALARWIAEGKQRGWLEELWRSDESPQRMEVLAVAGGRKP